LTERISKNKDSVTNEFVIHHGDLFLNKYYLKENNKIK
jgi:hypothetical protein